MPKVYLTEGDRLVTRATKELLGKLRAEGITYKTIAEWLDTTPQNVGQHFKKRSFNYKQVLIMQNELEKIYHADEAARL